MTTLTQAIDNTIAWLETDPVDRITGQCAMNENGGQATVLDPNACGWCVLGYLARELELDAFTTDDVLRRIRADIGDAPVRLDDIWSKNDTNKLDETVRLLSKLKEHVHD